MSMIDYRFASPPDMQSIVNLHVAMSQTTYAHILPESYLKDVVPKEKQILWEGRFSTPEPDQVIAVAVIKSEIVGFCCFPFTEETEFGTYLHNLYVSSSHQRRGIARSLLRWSIEAFDDARKKQPVHLVAFAKNTKAVAMYDRLGGSVIGRYEVIRAGNPPVDIVRYQWLSAHELLHKLGNEMHVLK